MKLREKIKETILRHYKGIPGKDGGCSVGSDCMVSAILSAIEESLPEKKDFTIANAGSDALQWRDGFNAALTQIKAMLNEKEK